MNEKHEVVLKFFNENNIDLPIDVANALQDVFDENELVQTVEIYSKEDIDEIESDIQIVNEIDVFLSKPSSGSFQKAFTYFGYVDHSVSEFVKLYDLDNKVLENITNIDNRSANSKIDSSDYVILLIETVEWGNLEMTTTPILYVYCPESFEEE